MAKAIDPAALDYVSFADWWKTVSANPLRFKFEGFQGHHRDVVDAALEDEGFCQEWWDGERSGEREELDLAIKDLPESYSFADAFAADVPLPSYASWLNHHCAVLDEGGSVLPFFEVDNDNRRDEWATARLMYESITDFLDPDTERPYLLENHPPVAVYSAAYGGDVPLDKVYFICPSCHNEPHTWDDATRDGHIAFHCGLCGAVSVTDGEYSASQWAADVGARLWPYIPFKPGDKIVFREQVWGSAIVDDGSAVDPDHQRREEPGEPGVVVSVHADGGGVVHAEAFRYTIQDMARGVMHAEKPHHS